MGAKLTKPRGQVNRDTEVSEWYQIDKTPPPVEGGGWAEGCVPSEPSLKGLPGEGVAILFCRRGALRTPGLAVPGCVGIEPAHARIRLAVGGWQVRLDVEQWRAVDAVQEAHVQAVRSVHAVERHN